MKQIFLVAVIFYSCSRSSSSIQQSSNQDKVKANTWKAYDYRLNGVVDNAVIASEPTFQFRSDGRMYFSQINPVYRDTLSYTFTDDNDLKLTRPSFPTYLQP